MNIKQSTGSNKKKNDVAASLQLLIQATEQYLPKRTLVLNGVAMKSEAVVAALQKAIDQIKASDAAHTAWLHAAQTQRTEFESTVTPLIDALRQFVGATFGVQSPQYAAFGFAPRRKPQRSAESKAAAALKLRATRQARNTLGRKQRLKVKGVVPAESPQPSTAASPVAAAPSSPVTTSTTPNGVAPANGAPNGSGTPNGSGSGNH